MWTGAEQCVKKDPPALGELSSQTPFASGLDGSGLDNVAEKTPESQTGLMNAPHYSKKRWLHFIVKKCALFKLN